MIEGFMIILLFTICAINIYTLYLIIKLFDLDIPLVKPSIDQLKPWTIKPKTGKKPKINDDETAWRKENGI